MKGCEVLATFWLKYGTSSSDGSMYITQEVKGRTKSQLDIFLNPPTGSHLQTTLTVGVIKVAINTKVATLNNLT